ncbi:MAG: FISUMP domain-containing protein [Bacteroidales bacterium]
MKIRFIILLATLLATAGQAQEISLTFAATGEASHIDSIQATNLSNGLSISFPGNATLWLNRITHTNPVESAILEPALFPNPFPGVAQFSVRTTTTEALKIQALSLDGQVVTSHIGTYQPGNHQFLLSLQNPGIYLIEIAGAKGRSTIRAISTAAYGSGNHIHQTGLGTPVPQNTLREKSTGGDYILGFTRGDLLHFRCYSGRMTSVLTARPEAPGELEVGFWTCTDPHNQDYATVRIGDQVWMAENLAYLPTVRSSSSGSDLWPHNYVYGYEDTNAEEARNHPNYARYGVLYNWVSAMGGSGGSILVPSGVRGLCPIGWHMPSQGEWDLLSTFIGDSAAIRLKDAGPGIWPGTGGGATNESGFGALPGGSRQESSAGFAGLGATATFWSTSEGGSSFAWYRFLEAAEPQLLRYGIHKANGFSIRCVKD